MSAEFEELEGELSELTKSVDGLSRNVAETQAAIVALSDEVTEIGDEMPTKRELVATAAMHSLMQRLQLDSPSWVAENAVKYADALLAELAKPVTEGGAK